MRRLALVLLVACPAGLGAQTKDDFIPLFNGRNLDGWTAKIKGYDAGSGKELWTVGGLVEQCIPSPVARGDRAGQVASAGRASHPRAAPRCSVRIGTVRITPASRAGTLQRS